MATSRTESSIKMIASNSLRLLLIGFGADRRGNYGHLCAPCTPDKRQYREGLKPPVRECFKLALCGRGAA